jgi:uncharacterized NAD-dependent epimerase/dehydratase family protein
MSVLEIRTPYLVFLGAVTNPLDAKTGRGLTDWRPELCVGQLRLDGCGVDLGLPDMTPAQARVAGAGSLVIGIASFGGAIEPEWQDTLLAALDAGLDIVSGMHTRLGTSEALRERAVATGRRLVDVRRPPGDIPVGNGRRRGGRRVLTVGTDCCVGKKYTALALQRELAARGAKATFRATGQTGILISGGGMPIDAVVSDFLSGAAELLSPDNEADHWDVIEGQGSLFHPAYAAVTLGLLHGSQPDAIVVCHDAARTRVDGYPDFPLPSLSECARRSIEAGQLTNPGVRVIGISLNTAGLSPAERKRHLDEAAQQTGLPAVDPVATGVGPLADVLLGFGAP